MKLKNATLLAIIGLILSAISPLYYFFISLEIIDYIELIGKTLNFLQLASTICVLVFFIVLYSNQKE
ncbi:hypothetical protein UT300019_05250 [Clostridium sp. CTA-19]